MLMYVIGRYMGSVLLWVRHRHYAGVQASRLHPFYLSNTEKRIWNKLLPKRKQKSDER